MRKIKFSKWGYALHVSYMCLMSAVLATGLSFAAIFYMFELKNPLTSRMYDKVSNYYINDTYVDSLYYLCDLRNGSIEKVICAVDFVKTHYSYELQDGLNSPKYTLQNESDCKNAAIYYCSVFRKMGMVCKIEKLNNHVFNVVEFEEGYCTVDQTVANCIKYLLSP